MNVKNYDEFIKILKKEVVPALGCTEPIAVALAAAKAREVLKVNPEKTEVYVSANIYKNGMGVGIPGTGMVGLDIAAALGVVGGNSEEKLEVLKAITKEDIAKSKELVDNNEICVKPKDVPNKLYVEAVCINENHVARVVIKDMHSNIVLVQYNDEILFEAGSKAQTSEIKNEEVQPTLTVEKIYDFALNADFKDIEFILEGAKLNKEISKEGLKEEYGLKVGKTIFKNIEEGILGDDMQNYAMAITAAASDARMAGSMLSVMSNSGSGNQGITVMLPVVAVAEKIDCDDEKLARALILSNLVAIHIKTYLGRLSALCGCVVASAGASCGITYLLGGKLENVIYAIKNMVGNITGMICDGAKTGCALKVSTGVSAAVQAALLAINNIEISDKDGIIHKDIERTIQNIADIGTKGMAETDKLILDIMTCK